MHHGFERLLICMVAEMLLLRCASCTIFGAVQSGLDGDAGHLVIDMLLRLQCCSRLAAIARGSESLQEAQFNRIWCIRCFF